MSFKPAKVTRLTTKPIIHYPNILITFAVIFYKRDNTQRKYIILSYVESQRLYKEYDNFL